MKVLREWIDQEGPEGRRLLFEAIKAKHPGFTQVSLTNYLQGQRVPDYDIADIIAQVTGIPIFLLSFRFLHRPRNTKS
jgi:transcriptional regulator with XRE-family HTH domain